MKQLRAQLRDQQQKAEEENNKSRADLVHLAFDDLIRSTGLPPQAWPTTESETIEETATRFAASVRDNIVALVDQNNNLQEALRVALRRYTELDQRYTEDVTAAVARLEEWQQRFASQ